MTRRSKRYADRHVVPWARRRCLSLTTYRRDGTPVASPVWFVTDRGEVRVWTESSSGKLKRLRHNPTCTIAPCTILGRVTGDAIYGHARILPAGEGPSVQSLLRGKYALQKRMLEAYAHVRRRGRPTPPEANTYLAISITR
jgi:PPOX class probable F420-dependent enzyme